MSKTMGCQSRVCAEVSWALSGTTITRLFLDPHTTVGKLKTMLETPAKTPSEFLEILCDGSKLKDSACTSSFVAFASPSVALLAVRREPPKLIGFLKEVNQLDTSWDDHDDWSEVCSVLLKHPRFAGVARANAAGQTVLHLAVLWGSPAMVEEILMDGRVDVNARTRSGDTALDLAALMREYAADWRHARYERILSRIAEHATRDFFWDLLHEVVAHEDRRLQRVALECKRIASLILERASRDSFFDLLQEASAQADRRLLCAALGCRHGMDKFLAGVLVRSRFDAELLLSDFMTVKDSACRKGALQKQKDCRKKQALLAKAFRKQKLKGSTAADAPKRRYRTKASNSWKLTEFHFWC
ncbi:unnamed protein product [Symbiodinium sp. CCMP2592]|nr:unnamed protein product [Symbiodinium sp. CCMP2592]